MPKVTGLTWNHSIILVWPNLGLGKTKGKVLMYSAFVLAYDMGCFIKY